MAYANKPKKAMIYVNICFLGVFWYVRAEPTYL